ncbi:sigma-70 family RNA polymerase sigma factor [bacterium]|nr:sigma-70 family RNA polymerase sigma factor [bacterium]
MSAEENVKLREYRDFIEIIAKVEYQKFSTSHLIELPELINIGTHALYILFKNNDPKMYNNTYLSTAIKWAIRNEVRRRYKWYTLKNKQANAFEEDENNEIELRAEVYKNILSIDELQEAEVPTQIKSKDKTPEESIEFIELKDGILEALKKLPPRERELIEYKFFKEKKLREISEEFNISQSRISRIIQSGLDRIKKDLAKQGII